MRNIILVLIISLFTLTLSAKGKMNWTYLDKGLHLTELKFKNQYHIYVLKIDPKYYKFKVLSAKELKINLRTAKQWGEENNLIACINAGMFQTDYLKNVGYMKNFKHINNKSVNHYQSVFAFNPVKPKQKTAAIYDLDKVKIKSLKRNYHSIIQNLRLIKGKGKNLWKKSKKKWSEAALAEDSMGNILFIFSRKAHSMHDFNSILLSSSLGIVKAQHLEGGPEASLYLNHNNAKLNLVGSFESNFNENNLNFEAFPIPNVIGIIKK